MNENFDDRKVLTAVLAIFPCACAESALSLLAVRNMLSPSLISHKNAQILATWQRFEFWPHFTAHAQKWQFSSFRLKLRMCVCVFVLCVTERVGLPYQSLTIRIGHRMTAWCLTLMTAIHCHQKHKTNTHIPHSGQIYGGTQEQRSTTSSLISNLTQFTSSTQQATKSFHFNNATPLPHLLMPNNI